MNKKNQVVTVELHFDGTADVEVPGHLSAKDAQLLASKIALARILATFENPDAPEEDALDEYAEEAGAKAAKTAEADWDAAVTDGVSGSWRGWPVPASVERRTDP